MFYKKSMKAFKKIELYKKKNFFFFMFTDARFQKLC